MSGDEFSLIGRPFLTSVFDALDPTENDYLALFALCLLYAIQQNSGRTDFYFAVTLIRQ
jgi:protein CLEC16A